ncbi:MAG: hypothetical protein GX053_12265 [Tissierella sp.]|nr:hypothetical protein [Tissierella sp.]
MKRIIEKGIQAILPVYVKDRGNCTVIYTKEDEVILDKTIKTTILNLCKYYHLDLKASNETYGKLLSIKKYPPIPFTYNQIFIPIKARIPIGKHDGAYGYVNINSIENISQTKSKDHSLLYLSDKRTIEVYSKDTTVLKSISKGEVIKKILANQNTPMIHEEENLYLAEEKVATKKDIAMVYKEIMRIKSIL